MSLVFGAAFIKGHAQVETGFELLQLVKIAEVYKASPSLSFAVSYDYADSTAPSTVFEHMDGQYKMSSGRYWMMLDSTEQVQGNNYNLSIYHSDSVISVNDRTKYSDQTRLPFLDSVFRNNNVTSMGISTYNDTTLKLTIQFTAAASYSKYEMLYDQNKFYIRSIKYYIRNVAYDSSAVTSGTAVVSMTMSNYSTGAFDPVIFNEDRFIYRDGLGFHLEPAFYGYTLINNTNH